MVILIESIVLCLLFTLVMFSLMYSNSLKMIHNCLSAIQDKARGLGIFVLLF